jgi:serine-type D-Ala-D-Ala carboxypeptidase/endopeptidase
MGVIRKPSGIGAAGSRCRTLVASALLLSLARLVAAADAPIAGAPANAETYADIDRIFADYALDAHVPGMVYGIVADGRLVYVRGLGVQDLESKRPVTADTLFRIASMTKAFTALAILKLRDAGKIQLEVAAENYIPELRGWRYPTLDSPRVRIRDLLNHTAGFVTDDPWGDRQTPLPEADFSQLLRDGVTFARAPETAMEYSNLGFALLGRAITNVSGRPYAETITQSLMVPLGMDSTSFFVDLAPPERRALGYRWEDATWRLEPTMGHGAFGAMGGIQTSANDYAKWMAFLLSAWPPRDDADNGLVKRATVRELAQGSNFSRVRARPGNSPSACQQAMTYGMGMYVVLDCDLGFTLNHSGGYPGYGSNVLLLPDRGVGIFAFTNRTYGGPGTAVLDAALALNRKGYFTSRTLPVSAQLATAYRTAGLIYSRGEVDSSTGQLAQNFLMDRDAAGWRRDLARLKLNVGECDTSAAISATSALAGKFEWRCSHGRVSGSVTLAPTSVPLVQEIKLEQRSQ